MKPRDFVLWAGLICLFFTAGLAQGRTVHTRGVGVAPVTKDAESARKVALMLAQRDAVERAVGAEVSAESVPSAELTRVVATTSGKLKYKILSEDAQAKTVTVEIEADVEVPDDLEAKYPRSAEQESTGFAPLIQKTPAGEINWQDGYLLARGVARLKGSDEKARAEARRAAQLDAYAQAMRMIAGLNLDADETVDARLKKAPAAEYSLRGLIQGAEVVGERSPAADAYEVTIKVPLRGLKGVQRAFSEGQRAVEGRSAEPEAEITGIIVDARGLGGAPAVFPEIVDEDGKPVYTVEMIDPAALMARGAAAYVTGAEAAGTRQGALPPGMLRVTALRTEPLRPRSFLASLADRVILLAQAAQRVVLRQGARPATVKAAAVSAPTRSRIVVSNQAAGQIRKVQNGALRQARVVVITDSMIGGTEGRARRVIIGAR